MPDDWDSWAPARIFWHGLPTIETVASYATTLAAFAIIWIVIQTGLQRRAVNADEARLARESAVFVYSVFGSDQFRTDRKTLGAKYEQAWGDMSDDTKSSFRAVLHNYGLVSLAFVEGGISAEVIESYWGSILVKDWIRLKRFVDHGRMSNTLLHRNTEEMVKAVEQIRLGN